MKRAGQDAGNPTVDVVSKKKKEGEDKIEVWNWCPMSKQKRSVMHSLGNKLTQLGSRYALLLLSHPNLSADSSFGSPTPTCATATAANDDAIQMAVRSQSFGRQYLGLVSEIVHNVSSYEYVLFHAETNESGPEEPLRDPKKAQTRDSDQE
jgi:hypothetical protein